MRKASDTITQPSQQSLEAKIASLEKANESLSRENQLLRDQNAKLAADLEVANKINENLKEKMTINLDQKLRRKATSLYTKLPIDARENLLKKVSSYGEEIKESVKESEIAQSPDIRSEKEGSEASPTLDTLNLGEKAISIEVNTAKKETTLQLTSSELTVPKPNGARKDSGAAERKDSAETKKQEENKERSSQTEKLIHGILDTPQLFYNLNNVVRLFAPSPFSRMKITSIEKHLDETEIVLRKWTKSIKVVNGSCVTYLKSLDTFANQLLAEKKFFEFNKELQNVVVLVAQFLKENAVYLEVLTKVINNSICNFPSPLKSFYKDILPSYKDSKKKVQKLWEEMETMEAKYLSLKRSHVLKDPFNGQNALKAYMNAYRNFEIARLDHLRNLNDINMNFNIEFIDKMCAIFTSNLAYLNSSFDLVAGLEGQVQTYTNSVSRKSEVYNELAEEYKKLKNEVERNIYIKYPVSLFNNIVKEGYLYIKNETKDFKKRYCVIQENGMLCWVKEPENSSEEPQLKELADIKMCKVKESTESDLLFCFELVSVLMKKPIILQADSEASVNEWISTIQRHTETVLFKSPNVGSNLPIIKRTDNSSPKSQKHIDQEKINSAEKTSKFKQAYMPNSPTTTKTKQSLVSDIIENNVCADCGAKNPSWVSLNLATVICIECSGIHRRLGPHISKVRSLKLDNLSLPILELFSGINMKEVNRVWEGAIDETPSMKPDPDSDQDRREAWIRNKYVEKVFVKPLASDDHIKEMCQALKEKNILKVLNVLAFTKEDLNGVYNIDGRRQGILHYACANSTKDIVELLIRNGCSLDLADQDSCKPLDHSMIGNNVEVMEYLVSKLDETEK